jgi:hypothetical protein
MTALISDLKPVHYALKSTNNDLESLVPSCVSSNWFVKSNEFIAAPLPHTVKPSV